MLNEVFENFTVPILSKHSTFIQNQKKMTAPGLAHRKRSGETNPFEVNVSTTIEHYITWGLALPYPFSKKDR